MKFKLNAWKMLLVLTVAVAGCAPTSPYLPGYRFGPQPGLAVLFKPASQSPAVSSMASVIGVRRGDPEKSVPPAVEIKIRFENSGQEAVHFDPASLSLVTGMLQPMGAPEVHPRTAVDIAPGQTQTVSLFFPYPKGAEPRTLVLEALRLRWQVTLGDKPFLQTLVFERVPAAYYE